MGIQYQYDMCKSGRDPIEYKTSFLFVFMFVVFKKTDCFESKEIQAF